MPARLCGMVDWLRFTREAPELAATVRARFTAEKSHVLATLRRDGSPRVSGTEVDFSGSELMIGSMLDAMKARDLRRDGRCAIHAFPSANGDAKVAGVAIELTDPREIEAVQGNADPCHLFRLDLSEAVLTAVEGNALVVTVWRPGESVVRFERPDNGPAVRVNTGPAANR
ncbi:pyridoxamine 5'-phosphate oxidase family protein [Amycolatopsis pigmentata]|uniref:Pyridoxamine 5'-phosphate oxidase family protein n=1 Tax=Amycolatopsis pigmentata TaxID=450801 RepID=A0ABW5FXA1_9PSEU